MALRDQFARHFIKLKCRAFPFSVQGDEKSEFLKITLYNFSELKYNPIIKQHGSRRHRKENLL